MTLTLVVATANPDKAAEIAAIMQEALGDAIEILPRPEDMPDVVEDGETLVENARLKARAVLGWTETAALADDTGLEVDALDGAPGVYSARFAGEGATYEENVAKLLAELERVGATTPEQRRAHFKTVVLIRFPDGSELSSEGSIEGTISTEPRGTNGFGYDPVFVPDDADGRTLAEMSADEKHARSHRGWALRFLAQQLRSAAS
jgi:XTP/dITP diphosphohydrolase